MAASPSPSLFLSVSSAQASLLVLSESLITSANVSIHCVQQTKCSDGNRVTWVWHASFVKDFFLLRNWKLLFFLIYYNLIWSFVTKQEHKKVNMCQSRCQTGCILQWMHEIEYVAYIKIDLFKLNKTHTHTHTLTTTVATAVLLKVLFFKKFWFFFITLSTQNIQHW